MASLKDGIPRRRLNMHTIFLVMPPY